MKQKEIANHFDTFFKCQSNKDKEYINGGIYVDWAYQLADDINKKHANAIKNICSELAQKALDLDCMQKDSIKNNDLRGAYQMQIEISTIKMCIKKLSLLTNKSK